MLGLAQCVPRLRRRQPRAPLGGLLLSVWHVQVACIVLMALVFTSPAPVQILAAFASSGVAWVVLAVAG